MFKEPLPLKVPEFELFSEREPVRMMPIEDLTVPPYESQPCGVKLTTIHFNGGDMFDRRIGRQIIDKINEATRNSCRVLLADCYGRTAL